MKRLACPAAVLAVSMMFGCNTGSNDQTVQNATPTGTSTPMQPVVINGVGTEPAQAVAVFLDSLRRGDESAANGVLTLLAREQVQKTNYQIQPPGTPEGKYEIGRVGFPYPEKTVALVECQWSEPSIDGQKPEVTEIVCEVHQEAEGWRISALVVTIAETGENLVLDFENAGALQATLEGATTPPGAQTQTAQAQTAQAPGATQMTQPLQPNLPQQQIAFPPINNAPVNR